MIVAKRLLRMRAPIENLEPIAALSLSDVRAELVFGNDAFQVQLADTLKKRSRNPLRGSHISAEMGQMSSATDEAPVSDLAAWS